MAAAHAWFVALFGIDGVPVKIEAASSADQPNTRRPGWPDALSEARDRVYAAVRNSDLPSAGQVVLALTPDTVSMPGPASDLAIATAVLAAAGLVPAQRLEQTVLLGELALDGRIRPVRGVLPAMLAAHQAGLRHAVVPSSSMPEAELVPGMQILGAERLSDVVEWLRGERDLVTGPGAQPLAPPEPDPADLADVVGQPEAAWALEIAAAGGHPLLFIGRPGTGMSMLARRLPGLLPPLSDSDAVEVTAVYSVAGLVPSEFPLISRPPFVAPHHSTSLPALVGGGPGLARPGAISKAHNGVLFLAEAAEFGPAKLEAVGAALEDGEVRLARRAGIARYPCRFHLVLASDACPCRAVREQDCSCSPAAKRRYLARLSGPLLDRIDLRVRMRPANSTGGGVAAERTAVVGARVEHARRRAADRCAAHGWRTNAEVPGLALRREFALPSSVTDLLDRSLASGSITVRGADRCLRVAWTLADLAGLDRPGPEQIAAALEFRDRRAA